jgi:hypothetical protein
MILYYGVTGAETRMIELGYDVLEEEQSETTNFSFITKRREERSTVLIDIISPKSKDMIILHSTKYYDR